MNEKKQFIAAAIDGPAGAGKSTIARTAAKELGFIYIDTGAMYRSIGLACLNKGIDPGDAGAVEALLPDIAISIVFKDGEQHIILNGNDVSDDIRTESVSMAASRVSAVPAVRAFLLELRIEQRKLRAPRRRRLLQNHRPRLLECVFVRADNLGDRRHDLKIVWPHELGARQNAANPVGLRHVIRMHDNLRSDHGRKSSKKFAGSAAE